MKKKIKKAINSALKNARCDETVNSINEISIYDDYCEPGYSLGSDKKFIALGNWNRTSVYDHKQKTIIEIDRIMPDLCEELEEKCSCEIEWIDEWEMCPDCGKIYRISPNSYGWKPYYHTFKDDGSLCGDCIKETPHEYLEELIGNHRKCLTFDIDLEEEGYIKFTDKEFENGLHPGQNDSPKNVSKTLKKNGIDNFIFELDEVSQFYVTFTVWIHEDEIEKHSIEKINNILKNEVPEGPNNSLNLRNALKNAPIQTTPGILLTKIDIGTGTVETKNISVEDFVKKGIG